MRRIAWMLVVLGATYACGERAGFENREVPAFVDPDAGAGVAPSGSTSCENTVRCSRDFRSVVDGCDDSKIIAECAPELGCASSGKCVTACEAATDSTMGCEFVALPPPREPQMVGSCFGAVLANTWGIPARIEAAYGVDPIDVKVHARIVRTDGDATTFEPFDGELKPGEMAAIFLSEKPSGTQSVRCPEGAVPAIQRDTAAQGTVRSPTFQIKTTAPVSAYSFYPFGKSVGSTATLLLPLASWKNDYVVTNVWSTRRTSSASFFPTTQILAAQDNTEITLIPSAHLYGGPNVDGAEKGKPAKYHLSRGEQIQFSQDDVLTGTRISADKPIGVSVGHQQMFIPDNVSAADSSQTALFPLKAWGNEYVLVPYRSRRAKEVPEEYLYRITGAVDGTELTYEPSKPKDAPPSIGAGQSITFMTHEPFVVKSQDTAHPFMIHAYMTGATFVVPSGDNGDPEFMTVIPTEQYLGRYVFWVEPNYANSHLVVVRVREEGKDFKPVVLDCAGPLEDWTPLGTSGKYEFTRPWLKKRGTPQPFGTNTCNGGRREITSDGPVAVTVWGTDRFGSYGYPGGAGLRELNSTTLGVH